MPATVRVIGEDVAAAQLVRGAQLLPFGVAEATRGTAQQGQARVVGRSPYAGTPPFVYRDSWDTEVRVEDGMPAIELFNTVPYARRIDEDGYHGTDRLGRTYDVRGRPIVRPATEGLADDLEFRCRRALDVL